MMTVERPEDQRARQTSGAVAGMQAAQLPAHRGADTAAVASRGDATQCTGLTAGKQRQVVSLNLTLSA